MITYKNLLILQLCHLTEWKNDKEMYVPNDMMEKYAGAFFTCEFLGNRRYILRSYYENGSEAWEQEYKDGKRNGKHIGWYENRNKHWEEEYKDGKRNGKYISWYKNGNKHWEEEYKDGKRNGKYISWYKNRNKHWEEEYKDGKLIRTIK